MSTIESHTQSLPQGTQLEEFIIENILGAGGFGITYLAHDSRLGRKVVIKENLPAQFCYRDTHALTVAARNTHAEDADNFQWSLDSFAREASILASLDHPGIVRVLRSFEAYGTAYFVMPFVEGMPLNDLADSRHGKNKPFTEDEMDGLLEHCLGALAYLHDRGIYHRDIKPANILITNEGMPVLIDFGSARQKLSERSMTVIESAGYTPFEQLQSRGNVGPWSDIYALGGTMAKMITGTTPPKAADRILDDPWTPLRHRQEMAMYSENLLGGIDRAFAANLKSRWQDAGEWLKHSRGVDAPSMAQDGTMPPPLPPQNQAMPAYPQQAAVSTHATTSRNPYQAPQAHAPTPPSHPNAGHAAGQLANPSNPESQANQSNQGLIIGGFCCAFMAFIFLPPFFGIGGIIIGIILINKKSNSFGITIIVLSVITAFIGMLIGIAMYG